MYTHLLLPTDGSTLSSHAVDEGLALAKALGAKATILTVVEPFHAFNVSSELLAEVRENYEKSSRDSAGKVLQAAADRADALGVRAETVLAHGEHPDRQIIEAATSAGCDLVMMASHGRRGVDALLLGSVTQKVLTHSSLPVLVLRPQGGSR